MFFELSLFGINVSSYNALSMIGVILAFGLMVFLNKKRHDYQLPFADLLLFFMFILVGVFLGARFIFILTHIPLMIEDPAMIPKVILFGGMVFYGGVIGGIVSGMTYLKMFGLDPVKFTNLAFVSIPLGHGCGRIGCFMVGCCHGTPTDSVLGVSFPAGPNHAVATEPLHPTQLYEVAFNMALLALLIVLFFKKKPSKPMFIPGVYLTSYAVFRFFIEFLRGDDIRGVFWLSTSQWISIGLFALGVFLLKGPMDKIRLFKQTPPLSKKYQAALNDQTTQSE